ncbi:MAG: tail fiber domain-containing protein, partial [Minisyncoccia bacterium]
GNSTSIASGKTIAYFTNAGGTAYLSNLGLNVTSDIRLKKNIEPLAPVLASVLQLQPVTYNFNSEASGTPTHTGFIAQQVQPIFPDLVNTDSQGMLSLNYADLTPYLVKAMQEIVSISGVFEQNLIAWLGNAANGIGNLFANNIHAQNELCVGSTCVTPAQFQAMVAVVGQSSNNAPASAPSSPADATTTPPVIQINGDNPAIIQVGSTYADLGATITGPQADLNLGIQTFVGTTPIGQAVIDTSAPATYHIYYVVTDANGITATSTRTVIVQAANDNEEATTTAANDNGEASSTTATSTTAQ